MNYLKKRLIKQIWSVRCLLNLGFLQCICFLFIFCNISINCTFEHANKNTGSDGLTVIGIVTFKELHKVPAKIAGTPDKFETRFTLNLQQAYDYLGKPMDLEEIFEPIFAGSPELLEKFEVGDRVKIVCTSTTGSHIKSMELSTETSP